MRTYHQVSGLLFAIVGFGHLVRAVRGSVMQIGTYNVPIIASIGVFVLCTAMAVWSFRSLNAR